MVTVLAANASESASSGSTLALIAVVALTLLFTVVQARRTTLRRGKNAGETATPDRAPDEPRRDDS